LAEESNRDWRLALNPSFSSDTWDGRSNSGAAASRWRDKLWLHILLFVLTVATSTVFGTALASSFFNNRPLDLDMVGDGYIHLLHADPELRSGLWFSVPLLFILLAHEFGHYFACRYWNVEASLPYFLPSPTLMGTLGAFIRIRSPIYTRRSLFDIGFSGPIAGFIALLPFLIAGVWMSRAAPGIASHGDFTFGTPLALRIVEQIRFPGINPRDISLHPIARAAWAGLLATAINLLPIGQLDGGHILFAFFGAQHRQLSRWFALMLVPLGIFYWPWIVWAAVLLFFGLRHPLVYDPAPVDAGRVKLGVAALIIFALSFSLIPVEQSA
jgi:membrane-associated protease RseP (regulator of RpoE activity)